MNYTLQAQQPDNYLIKADEILFKYNHKEYLPEFKKKYPDKVLILDTPVNTPLEEILPYCDLDIVFRLHDLFLINDIPKWFYASPVATYEEFQALKKLNPTYISVKSPLTFDKDFLENQGVKIRMCPNIAYDAYIPQQDALTGQWVRPEDVSLYETFIDVFDFEDCSTWAKERELFNIYKSGSYVGNLAFLITNLNYGIDNKKIPEEFAETRINCRKRCARDSSACHFCENCLKFFNKLYRKDK